LRHLPGHLLDSEQWDEAHDLLTTLSYVEAKAQAGYVGDLAEDFKAAAEAAPRSRRAEARILRVLGRAIEHEMGFLWRHPGLVFQVCWNRGWWTDAETAGYYFEVEEDAEEEYQPPWAREGPKVSDQMERWRLERAEAPWVRRLLPPRGLFAPDQTVLRGHEDRVNHVAWSPSGERLASASTDDTVRVWDPTGEAEPLVLHGHERTVNHVTWSPSGERLASASDDCIVRVWDPTGQAEPLVLRGHEARVYHVAWSPSGERLASTCYDGTVRVWAPQTGAQLDCFEGYRIPESFFRASDTRSPYVWRALPTETRIEHRRGETPIAWFEASGYEDSVQAPGSAPVWAARSGPSVLIFALEDATE
jgi:hypothetical protein